MRVKRQTFYHPEEIARNVKDKVRQAKEKGAGSDREPKPCGNQISRKEVLHTQIACAQSTALLTKGGYLSLITACCQ